MYSCFGYAKDHDHVDERNVDGEQHQKRVPAPAEDGCAAVTEKKKAWRQRREKIMIGRVTLHHPVCGIDEDALIKGESALIVDDVLATGGTAAAAGRLVSGSSGMVAGFAFLIELDFLKGRSRLAPHAVVSLLHY